MFEVMSPVRLWTIRRPYQVIFVLLVTLTAYFPVIKAELCRLDDVGMVEWLNDLQSVSFGGVFLPRAHDGGYYRPLLALTFVADKYLWSSSPWIMHVENICLHAFNGLLVYWLTFQLLRRKKNHTDVFPLLAAFLFILHPINTESVNWLSGRTDILAAAFVLLSANLLIKCKTSGSHSRVLIAGSIGLLFLGFLSKEVSLAFVPGAFLILASSDQTSGAVSQRTGLPANTTAHWRYYAAILVSVAVFSLLRSKAYLSNHGKLYATLQIIFSEPLQSLLVFVSTVGYYAKKLFMPMPLNFAIVEIDPLYEIVGVPVVVFCLFMARRRSLSQAFFLSGMILIVPAFPFAFGKIAWTPYAERYLYLPSAFIVTSLVYFINRVADITSVRRVSIVFGTIIFALLSGTVVFHRSTVWLSNYTLFKDTAEKSPTSPVVRSEYAHALLERGDYSNARIQYTIANSLNQPKLLKLLHTLHSSQPGYWAPADLGLARILEFEGKRNEAAEAYEKIYSNSDRQSHEALGKIISLYSDMLYRTTDAKRSDYYKRKLRKFCKEPIAGNISPHSWYRLGKILLLRGESHEALKYFSFAYDTFADDDIYKQFAHKFIGRLKPA